MISWEKIEYVLSDISFKLGKHTHTDPRALINSNLEKASKTRPWITKIKQDNNTREW